MVNDDAVPAATGGPSTRCAVVAGGSGGLGRGICDALARSGRSIAILYRSRTASADALCKQLTGFGVASQAWQVDLQDPDALVHTIAQVVQRFGGISTAVYAAGPAITVDHLARISTSEFSRVLHADVVACFNFIRTVLPEMRRGGGALIGITTEQLERIESRGMLSSVPKAAVDKLFTVVAKEEARHGIRAATVRAGWIDVGLGAEALAETLAPEVVKGMIASIPLRRFGTPREVGDIVAFLASDQASYITGVSIPVNGGRHL